MVLLAVLLLKWCVLLLLYWSFRYIVVLLIGCVLLMLCVFLRYIVVLPTALLLRVLVAAVVLVLTVMLLLRVHVAAVVYSTCKVGIRCEHDYDFCREMPKESVFIGTPWHSFRAPFGKSTFGS